MRKSYICKNGIKEDDYAESTQRYNNVNGALKYLFANANIEDPNKLQDTLF